VFLATWAVERCGVRRQDPERVLKDIGRRVAEIRAEHEMTQERFAEEVLGVSLKYLQAVEAGRENLSVASLVKLSNLARVRVAELFSPPATRKVRRGREPVYLKGEGCSRV
jgi:transcriptional regulator with XRE-family HTH domain